MGWMFATNLDSARSTVPDLRRDPIAMAVTRGYFVWLIAGIVLPGFIVWAFDQTAFAFLRGILWGGLARIFLVHHVTWSINSLCHLFGSTPYETGDESRNNALCAVLACGEGWHNNHHAFPTSARHGLHWWQFDLGYALIRLLVVLGLATRVNIPAPGQIEGRATPVPKK